MKSAPSTEGTNPNNCGTCNHAKTPDGGWCYMFRDEPKEVCYQHTGRTERESLISLAMLGGAK